MQSKNNLDLWNQVCTTNPNHTKKVNQRGGFTAISAMYQLQTATDVWGSYGSTWGIKNCKYEYIRDAKNNIIELVLEAIFYYPSGEFEISTDIRYAAGQDCRKKILTDLTTKALSKLGFNADVFLGKYDDNKYIKQVQEIYRKSENSASITGLGVPKSKKATLGEGAFNKLVDRLNKKEGGLLSKVIDMFKLTTAQQKIIDQYGTEN
jgi:hypothetical protein